MKREDIEQGLKIHLNRNYDVISQYYNMKPTLFKDLILQTYEINRCLLVEANMAAITLTNYTVERLLKLALIADEHKLQPIDPPWKENIERVHNQYMMLDMYKTINLCCSKGLISKIQKNDLHKFRERYRNGFSHSFTDSILEGVETPYPLKDIMNELRKDPEFQAREVYNFAKANALSYYDYVINLIFEIEKRINSKYNS